MQNSQLWIPFIRDKAELRPLVDLAQLPIELKEREEVGKKDLCLLGKLNSKMRDRE